MQMTPDLDLKLDMSGPRAIYEVTGYGDQTPEIDNLYMTTFETEDLLLAIIEGLGWRLGEGIADEIPAELQTKLQDFVLEIHAVINSTGEEVAAIGVLHGDEDKLQLLNTIIQDWRNTKDCNDD